MNDRLMHNLHRLTDNERVVLRALREGLIDREIARQEGMSERTVERVVAGLEVKFDARTRYQLSGQGYGVRH